MRDLTQILGIRHDQSTAYHHESLGTVERSHKTMNEYLRSYMEENKDWPTMTKFFAYCFNTTPNSSIGMYFPFEVVFGRTPTNIVSEGTIGEDICNVNEYVVNIKHNLDVAFKRTNKFVNREKLKSKNYYDKTARPLE